MKFKLGLTIAFLLTLPGAYAIVAWSLADFRSNATNVMEMEPAYRAAFPHFAGTMKATILCLVGLCVTSVVIILNIDRGLSALQRRLRIVVLLLALLTAGALGFALM